MSSTATSERKLRQTPELMERMLKSIDAIRAIAPEVRRRALAELQQRKVDLQKRASSAPWFDACWREGEKFPPHADLTPMVQCGCDRCQARGTLWPRNYIGAPETTNGSADSGRSVSYECYIESLSDWEAAQLPSSPSGLALRAIREGRIRLRRQRTRIGRR